MIIEAEHHPEILLLMPLAGVSYGECANEECQADHWRLSIGWFVWSMHFIF